MAAQLSTLCYASRLGCDNATEYKVPVKLIGTYDVTSSERVNFITSIQLPQHRITEYLYGRFNLNITFSTYTYSPNTLLSYLLYEQDGVCGEIEPCNNTRFLLDRSLIVELPVDTPIVSSDSEVDDILSALAFTMKEAVEDSDIQEITYCFKKQRSLVGGIDIDVFCQNPQCVSHCIGHNLYWLVFNGIDQKRKGIDQLNGYIVFEV
jgi:hypothetical protein